MEGWYHHGRGSNDWDLNAVVRYACGGRVSPPTSSGDPFSSFFPPPAPQEMKDEGMPYAATSLPGLAFNGDAAVVDELSIAFFGPSAARPGPPQLQQPQQQLPAATDEQTLQLQQHDAAPPPVPLTSGRQASGGGEGLRSKRKKKQVKKVVKRVAADGVSADPWAWRKYGQKPIKGSPHPRGYYRCSTDKACAARKMVERCRSEPDSFILTYTGDHIHPVPIHRNSLAGTTRVRQQRAEPPSAGGQSAPGGASATAEPSPGQSTSGGMSMSPTTTSPRSPFMDEECNQEEAEYDEAGGASMMPKDEDVEMAGEEDDELKTLLGAYDQPAMVVDGGDSSRHATLDGDGADTVSPFLNGVEGPFVVTPWLTALGDATPGWS